MISIIYKHNKDTTLWWTGQSLVESMANARTFDHLHNAEKELIGIKDTGKVKNKNLRIIQWSIIS